MTATMTRQPPLAETDLRKIDASWRAASYLSVGQIYLMDNPLLREPLRPEHVKPRLLRHWDTTPGLKRKKEPPPPRSTWSGSTNWTGTTLSSTSSAGYQGSPADPGTSASS